MLKGAFADTTACVNGEITDNEARTLIGTGGNLERKSLNV